MKNVVFTMQELPQIYEKMLVRIQPEHVTDNIECIFSSNFSDTAVRTSRKMRASKYNIFVSSVSAQTTTISHPCSWKPQFIESETYSWTPRTWFVYPLKQDLRIDSTFDVKLLADARDMMRSLFEEVEKLNVVESAFYNFEPVDRPPGFIIEILVVIPESNRETEYKIYYVLGELMRRNRKMLIDLHIVKRRGREIKNLIPTEFQRWRE